MVRFLKRGLSFGKSRKVSGEMFETGLDSVPEEKRAMQRQGSGMDSPLHGQQSEWSLQRTLEKGPKSRFCKERDGPPSELEMMKERFAKLLLGEDMSGGGKGVSSALAVSNAITNLAASVFGEQYRLEPLSDERQTRWRREIDWLLSITDHIVEFVPSHQTSKDGSNVEVMTTRQRTDLAMNIPALRKLDAMLIGYLDNFKDQNEFSYVSRDADDKEKGCARKDDKWWLPTVKVPPNGLPEVSRRWLHFQKDLVNQVLKAAMAINAQVLTEMEVPEVYIESLPKNGRASLGDAIYKSITDDHFDPDRLLQSLDLSTEHKVLDLKNRIEASIVIWKRKMQGKDGKSSWGSIVSLEKRGQFEDNAGTILHILKQRFPGIPQSSLDISKIQYNKDIGQAILESYSRILESLAFTVISRVEDVLYADLLAQDPSQNDTDRRKSLSDSSKVEAKKLDPKEEMEKLTDNVVTLSEFIGWHFDPDTETEIKKMESIEDNLSSQDLKSKKPPPTETARKLSYIEKLETLRGSRSPTARH